MYEYIVTDASYCLAVSVDDVSTVLESAGLAGDVATIDDGYVGSRDWEVESTEYVS